MRFHQAACGVPLSVQHIVHARDSQRYHGRRLSDGRASTASHSCFCNLSVWQLMSRSRCEWPLTCEMLSLCDAFATAARHQCPD